MSSSTAGLSSLSPGHFPGPVLQVVLRWAEPWRSGGHADADPPGRGLPDSEAGRYRLLRHHLQVSIWAAATSHSAGAPGQGMWEEKAGTAGEGLDGGQLYPPTPLKARTHTHTSS